MSNLRLPYEGGNQQFAGNGHAVTLVFAKCHQRTKQAIALWHHHDARLGGRAAMLVNQRARLYLNALVESHTHLALRNAAGGKIQHKRVLPL